MAGSTRARLFVAGTAGLAQPMLARIEVVGEQLSVLARPWVDPMLRSGRGGSSGGITALAGPCEREGGQWLLATVERGRPRLIDPESLGVVALLGRRREWRGAAELTSPFVPVICDRPPQRGFLLTRSPSGGVDLLRVCPGEAIERWYLGQSWGEFGGRVELYAGTGSLVLVFAQQVAIVNIEELVPGGCPLTDPRDVELTLRWRSLPSTVVAVCDLLEQPLALRVIERHGDRWSVSELDIAAGARVQRSFAIERPQRWLVGAGSLWLAGAEAWTRIAARQGPCERSSTLASPAVPATLEVDADGHPWLWLWHEGEGELHRVDALALEGRRERWSLAPSLSEHLRPQQLLALAPGPAVDARTVVHADELAELLALEPSLADAWARCFDR